MALSYFRRSKCKDLMSDTPGIPLDFTTTVEISTANTAPYGATSVAPPVSLGDIGHHAHAVQFYADDSFLLEALSRFIGTALGAGDAALVIATKAHRDGLEQRLKARGLETITAVGQGRYVVVDANETLAKFMRDGWPDADLFADTVGRVLAATKSAAHCEGARVAAFGEMVAVLWAEGKPNAAIRLEQLWNELAKEHSFSLLCAYPMSAFYREEHGAQLLQVCAEHSAVIPGESYTSLITEEERLRTIAYLQQKALALETEVLERKRVEQVLRVSEEALRKSHADLEHRVERRTRELFELTSRLRAEVEQRTVAEAHLRELSGRLLSMRDEERRRIARELHDSTGQLFVALQWNLALLEQSVSNVDPALAEKVSESVRIADQAINEVRTMSYLLHPPMLDEAGLLLAIHWYVDGFVKRSNIKVDLELPQTLERLPRDLETTVFRILQEALTNVHRHAGSSTARVQLTVAADNLGLLIQDQGKGIPRNKIEGSQNVGTRIGVGIRGMRERVRQFGGELQITPGNPGTCVEAIFPLPRDQERGCSY